MLFCKFYDFSYFRVYRPSNICKFKNVVVKMKIMLGKNQRHFWKVLNLLLLSLYYGHNDKPIISGCKMTLKVAKIAILAVFRGLYLKNRISKVVQIFLMVDWCLVKVLKEKNFWQWTSMLVFGHVVAVVLKFSNI